MNHRKSLSKMNLIAAALLSSRSIEQDFISYTEHMKRKQKRKNIEDETLEEYRARISQQKK